MRWVQRRYGNHVVHLLLMLSCFAVAGYALTRAWEQRGVERIFLWFVALLILHDLIGWPAYTLADRALQRLSRRYQPRRGTELPWINHVRVPFFISGVLLITAFPLILRLSTGSYASLSGLSESPYLSHWLLVTGLLFAGSAVLYVFRVWRAGRRRTKTDSA